MRDELGDCGVVCLDVVLHGGEGSEGTVTVFIDRRDVQSTDTMRKLNQAEFGPPRREKRVIVIAVARRPVAAPPADRDLRRRAPSPDPDLRRHARSPDPDLHRRAPSPDRDLRRRAPSPDRDLRRRAPSPDRDLRRRAPSPDRDRHRRGPSAELDARSARLARFGGGGVSPARSPPREYRNYGNGGPRPGGSPSREVARETVVVSASRPSAGGERDLFVLQNLSFDLTERDIRDELAGKGVTADEIILHGADNRRNNSGGANIFIGRGDGKSRENLMSQNHCEFGVSAPGGPRNLLVVPVDANHTGEYTICIAPRAGNLDVSEDRVRELLPVGTVREIRRVERQGKLNFFVDMCTLRDFSAVLLAPLPAAESRFFNIRAAPARDPNRASRMALLDGDGGGFGRDAAPASPMLGVTNGGDLRQALSRDPSNQSRVVLGRGGSGYGETRSPLAPPPPPRRGMDLSPRRDLSPMRDVPANRIGLSPSLRMESPGMQRWNRSDREPVGGRRSNVIPGIVDDMRGDSREDYVRLSDEMSDFCGKIMRDYPAFLVLNLPFLNDERDKSERTTKEADLKLLLEGMYKGLQIVHVKILDIRGAMAIVVAQNCSLVLGQGIDRKFLIADRLVRVSEFSEFIFLGKGYSRNPEAVTDLAVLTDSINSRTVIKPWPEKGEDFFFVQGAPFNLLMLLSMSGRFGRRGFRYVHTVDYTPPDGYPRLGSQANGHRDGGHESGGLRERENPSDRGLNMQLIVKGIPGGMYPSALANSMKKTLGLNDWIDAEEGPEPHSAIFFLKSSRAFDALLTQNGVYIKGFGGGGSNIDVSPYDRASRARGHGRTPSPRGVDFSHGL